MKKGKYLALAGWLALAYLASAVGGLAAVDAAAFYGALQQPGWGPPAWLFGPVWTVLYTMMGVAAWLVWRAGGFRGNPLAFSVFFLQLALNALWSWLFFTWRQGSLAFAEIAALWVCILVTLLLFWRVRPIAGALLVPYLAWVSFAAALNFVLWQQNPTVL